jgi:4-hydroxy-3-methylbut-2-enyl diphosphate reductase
LGTGPSRAAASAHELLAGPGRPKAAAVLGLGGALGQDFVPGDVVVADRLVRLDGHQVADMPFAPLIAGELRRAGLRARTGTVATSDHIVTGKQRHELRRLAEVVDMESVPVAEILGTSGTTVAVVRAISDSPQHELWSPAGAAGVARALISLRRAAPVLASWAQALGPRVVTLADPRSFCAGVRRAIETVHRAIALFGAPVYVRRQIVHNSHVVGELEAAGAVFVEELDQVPDGATVVFSAHGVGTAVQREAQDRKMRTVDATCPLVAKVHHEAKRFAGSGRQVVLLGHRGHDEVEGTMGSVPGIRLVSALEDLAELDSTKPTAVVTQTTLATDEVAGMMAALDNHFVDLVHPSASDICYASQNRQEAVRAMAPDCDVVLVVGSSNSSNTNRLVEVAHRAGVPAHLVEDEGDVRLSWLAGRQRIGITAGASAPEELVQRLVSCLAGLGPVTVSGRAAVHENVTFSLPVEVR